ncbi:MAG: HD domain-containing protein [Phycisphaerae bacterium]|nr:HD domain-containing protein [Phycisphaerae bacterium]
MGDVWLIPRGETGGMRLRLEPPGPVTIGRAPGHTMTLPDPSVSRLHATMLWGGDASAASAASTATAEHHSWRIVDSGSSAGTIVNGVRLEHGHSLPLRDGDVIEISMYSFEVRDRSARHAPESIVALPDDAAASAAVQEVRPEGAGALAQHHLLEILGASESIHQAKDDAAVRQLLVESVARITGFPNAALVQMDDESEDAELLASRGAVVDRFGRVAISRSIVRRARHGPVILRDGGAGPAATATINTLSIHRAICLPVRHGSSCFGVLYLDDRDASSAPSDLDAVTNVAHALVRMAAMSLNNLARARTAQRLEDEQRLMFGGTMHALIAAIDAKDPYTRGHSDRVSTFAALLAEHAKLGSAMVERARLCGLVHDIGKIGVPESVLRKPGRLTDEEFSQISAHPAIGREILRDIPQMHDVLPGVYEHHEKWDGSGYPEHRKGEEISQLGRIVCLADCFDAMTSARTYRPARPVGEVLEEIRRCLGTHFDPELGRIFASIPVETLALHVAPPIDPVAEAIPQGEVPAGRAAA